MQIDLIQLEALKNRLDRAEQLDIKIVSDSMSPLLKVDENVQVVPSQKNFEIFDLIVFWRDHRLVCHYVWRNQISFNKTVITRSLENPYTDEAPVPANHILGHISNRKIHFTKKMSLFVKNLFKGSY